MSDHLPSSGLLDPDMPAQTARLHGGEMNSFALSLFRDGIRHANAGESPLWGLSQMDRVALPYAAGYGWAVRTMLAVVRGEGG